jgi:hypothetical protein
LGNMSDDEAKKYIATSMENAVCLAAAIRRDLDEGEEQALVVARTVRTVINGGTHFALQYGACATVELARRLTEAEVTAHPVECIHLYGDEDETEGDDETAAHDIPDHIVVQIGLEVVELADENPDTGSRAENDQRTARFIDRLLATVADLRIAVAGKPDGDAYSWINRRMVEGFSSGNLTNQALKHAAVAELVLTKIPQDVIERYVTGGPEGMPPL